MGLFQDSLKKWFYTNNSSAASSDARVPLLNANGSPKGSDTMANLASVLGGLYTGLLTRTLSVEYELDDPTLSGVYAYAYGSDVNERGFLLAFPNTSAENGRRAIQVAFAVDGRTKSRTYESNRWGAWYRLDNFGCNSLADLASALGALQIIEDTSQGRQGWNVLSYLLEGSYGVQTIQNATDTTVTIPAGQRANRCALLIIGCNTRVPSMFMLSRDAVWGTVFEGNAISASDLTVNADESITVTKPAGLSIYYRMFVMEW